MRIIFILTGVMAFSKLLKCGRWPDPLSDKVIYVNNPIEADLPSHWIPLSIIKRVIELRVSSKQPPSNMHNYGNNKHMTDYTWKYVNNLKTTPGKIKFKSSLKLILSVTSASTKLPITLIGNKNTEPPNVNVGGDGNTVALMREEYDVDNGTTPKEKGDENDSSGELEADGGSNEYINQSKLGLDNNSEATITTNSTAISAKPLTDPDVATINSKEGSTNDFTETYTNENQTPLHLSMTIDSMAAVTSPTINQISTTVAKPSTTVATSFTTVTTPTTVATTTSTTTKSSISTTFTTTTAIPTTISTIPSTTKTTTAIPTTISTIPSTTTTTTAIPSTTTTAIPTTCTEIPTTTTTIASTTITTQPTTTTAIPTTISTIPSTTITAKPTTTTEIPTTTTTTTTEIPTTTTTTTEIPTTTTPRTSPTTTKTKTTEPEDSGDPFY